MDPEKLPAADFADPDRGVWLYRGNCLEILPQLPAGTIDGLLTDPPYSSGGQFRSDRNMKTRAKYVQTSSVETFTADFAGDNRDQRAFVTWCSIWLMQALGASHPGAVCCLFTDWRQLPSVTDALQAGGWIWRNLVTWFKPGSRMQFGRFSLSAEYVVYGSSGVPTPGQTSLLNVIECRSVRGQEKQHIAEKPLELMRKLVQITPPGALICDPFMGSGTTGAAAILEGRRFIGIELEDLYWDPTVARIQMAIADSQGGPLFAGPAQPAPALFAADAGEKGE